MTDADRPESPRASRPRPSYGLPGPTPGTDAASDAGASPHADQYGPTGQDDAPSPAPAQQTPQHGHPASAPYGDAPGQAWSTPPAAPRKRRGLWPLITGLVLMFVIAPALTIGGIVWGMGSLVGDVGSGPTALQGGSGSVELPANQMLVVYVPAEDSAATCTAEAPSASGGSPLTVVPSSGEATFGDGTRYVQKLGVVAMEDTTVTVSCQGTDAPAYLGPYSIWGMALPMIIGPVLGALIGLVGLVLVIIGIVKLVRSRRS